jgi:hypothetical protein
MGFQLNRFNDHTISYLKEILSLFLLTLPKNSPLIKIELNYKKKHFLKKILSNQIKCSIEEELFSSGLAFFP